MSIARFFAMWLSLAILMSANGVFRELVLKRALPVRGADVLSALIGLVAIVAITGAFLRPVSGQSAHTAALVAVALFVLTVGFEFAVGRLVDGKSWGELLANYEIWKGRLWPVLLAVLVASPFWWWRR